MAEHEIADANALDVRQASRDLGPLQVVDDDVAELRPDVAIELRRDDLAAAQRLALDVLDEPAVEDMADGVLRARGLLAAFGDGVDLGGEPAGVLATLGARLVDRDHAEGPEGHERAFAVELVLVTEADLAAGEPAGEETANLGVADGFADR